MGSACGLLARRRRSRLRRRVRQPRRPAPCPPPPPPPPAPLDPAKHPGVVTSPMVGTAYVGAEPGARPFVEVGSRVEVGDTLLIAQAMESHNPTPSPRRRTAIQALI